MNRSSPRAGELIFGVETLKGFDRGHPPPSVALPRSVATALNRNEKPKEIIMVAKRPDLFR